MGLLIARPNKGETEWYRPPSSRIVEFNPEPLTEEVKMQLDDQQIPADIPVLDETDVAPVRPEADNNNELCRQAVAGNTCDSIHSPELLQRVERIRTAMAEVWPRTTDEWLTFLRCDARYGSDLEMTEACVVVYQYVCTRAQLTASQKVDLFEVLVEIEYSIEGRGNGLGSRLPKVRGVPRLSRLKKRLYKARAAGKRP
jgi:hypothetical protein